VKDRLQEDKLREDFIKYANITQNKLK